MKKLLNNIMIYGGYWESFGNGSQWITYRYHKEQENNTLPPLYSDVTATRGVCDHFNKK